MNHEPAGASTRNLRRLELHPSAMFVSAAGTFFSILTLPSGPRLLRGRYNRFDETMRALD